MARLHLLLINVTNGFQDLNNGTGNNTELLNLLTKQYLIINKMETDDENSTQILSQETDQSSSSHEDDCDSVNDLNFEITEESRNLKRKNDNTTTNISKQKKRKDK